MLSERAYYQEEKRHLSHRLIVLLGVAIFSFIVFDYIGFIDIGNISYILMIFSIVSILHFLFILYRPNSFKIYRKLFLIIMDLALLTYLIFLLDHNGLFIFPIYIIIVIQSGIIFGIRYFYTSIIVASIALFILLSYSSYWLEHYHIVITFGMTTLFIPLLYLHNIIRIYAQRDELSQELSATEYRANYDILTGVANRKMYKEKITQSIAKNKKFALLFIDLNKFKIINDTHGHHIGDEVLKELTVRLREYMIEDDFIARLGGDEFVIITHKEEKSLMEFLEHIEDYVIGQYHIEGVVVYIELSIGVSIYPDDTISETDMSRYADKAMYLAKKSKYKHYIFYKDISSDTISE